MKFIPYIFISLLTIFSFDTVFAQLREDELQDTETLLVNEKLQKITGRIIQVVRSTSHTQVVNVCSGMLIGPNHIATASHCFKRNTLLTKTDLIKKTAIDLLTLEDFYFDIPGVTSKNLAEEIAVLTNSDGKISKQNKDALNKIISLLPKIQDIQILKEYENNMPTVIDTYRPKTEKQILTFENHFINNDTNYLGNIYDLSVAKLNVKLEAPDIEIKDLNTASESVFVSGFYGGSLYEPLRVFKCIHGDPVYEGLLPRTDLNDFAELLNHHDDLIVSQCDGEIIQGQSGGPQVQYKNGKLYLVGVNSGTIFGLSDHVISPRADFLKNKFTF